MTALEYFVQHPEKKHGKIAFSFTPDEEIGESQDHFNVEKFGADYAFTLDGEKCSEMSYENFNACSVKVTIKGFDVHPGNAKDVMINAADIGTEFNAMLPQWRKPCHTERYDGFFHLDDMSGNIENCVMDYLIREFDSDEFAAMKETMKENAAILNKRYGEGTVTVEITDSYRNMFDVIKDHMDIIEGTVSSIVKACGSYEVAPSRGGTDGAGLSFKGVPCPNLGTGSFNHHSTMEFANAQQMDKLVDVVVDILEI
jgi:Di- and tripeptidases